MEPLYIQLFGLNLGEPLLRLKFGGLYAGLARGLERAGVRIAVAAHRPDPEADVIIASPIAARPDLETAALATCAAIVLFVPTVADWFDRALLEHYRERILFAFGSARSEETAAAYRQIGLEYRYLPLATDPEIMRPLEPQPEPIYDLVFVGSLEHRRGGDPFVRALLEGAAGRRDLLVCTGGERFGITPQVVTWGPILNLLYNVSRVGVNFHDAGQKSGPDRRLDVNNRLFDLAAAGCMQVSDNVAAVREFFSEDEVPAFDDPADWIEAAVHFARLPEEARPFRERARQRALREHTWDQRAAVLLSWIREGLCARRDGFRPIPPPRWLQMRRLWTGRLRRVVRLVVPAGK